MAVSETSALIGMTKSLINTYGTWVSVSRDGSEWVTSPAGGQVRSGGSITLPPVKRWFQYAAPNDMFSANMEGDTDYRWGVLVGLPGDDIQKGDSFVINGDTWRVRYIHSARLQFETRAEVFT